MKTVHKALSLLVCFTEEHPDWSVTELSLRCGIEKSTVSRLLATLRQHNFVGQDPATRRYQPGLALVKLGRVSLGAFDLRRVSLPVMRELARTIGESIFLTVVAGVEALCVEKVEGPHPVRASFEVGRYTPLHAGASAKLLLAYMPPGRVRQVVDSRGLGRFTENTLADPERLAEDLSTIRRLGYALSDGELDRGVAAVAVPIFDGKGEVVASLSLAGPSARVLEQDLPGVVGQLQAAARRIAAGMNGGRPAAGEPCRGESAR